MSTNQFMCIREGESAKVLENGVTILDTTVERASQIAQVISNVVPVFGASATLESQYIELVSRSRIHIQPRATVDYIAATGREVKDGWISGAYVHTTDGEISMVDRAHSYGPGLIQFSTPLKNGRGHRVIPVVAITQISFDAE
jgi:hypothetical protein